MCTLLFPKSKNMATIDSRKISVKLKVGPADYARLGENSTIEQIHNHRRIGASLSKGGDVVRGLNFEEEKKYLGEIIGVSPSSQDWQKATRAYWCNITQEVPADEFGLELEVGFLYPDDAAAEKGREEEAAENAKAIAMFEKDLDYTIQFDVRQKVGQPINLRDYILYRHCLVYNQCANSPKLVNKSPKIRFYLYSREAAQADAAIKVKMRQKAYTMYLELVGDRGKVDNVIHVLKDVIQRYNDKPTNVEKIDVSTDIGKDVALEKLANEFPERLIAVASDVDLSLKAFIERAIGAGELKRLANTDTIIYGDNTPIGNSVNEAVAYLKSEDNREVLQTIKARLDAFKKG